LDIQEVAKKKQNHYEVMAIFSPELSEEEADKEVNRIKELLESRGCVVLSSARWKKRKLAYEIKHFTEGFYGVITFASEKEVIADVDYHLRYSPICLRYLILNLKDYKRFRRRRLAVARAEKSEGNGGEE